MTHTQDPTAAPGAAGLLRAAEAAAQAIPPAFPLEATVAVNPFLGQTGDDLAMAAARLGRVAGIRLTPKRADFAARLAAGRITEADLAEACAACTDPSRPASLAALRQTLGTERPAPAALPSVADLAAGASGIDWPGVIACAIGLWAAGHFDRGQALWTPAPGRSAFAAWREWATHDLTPELAGLTGFAAEVAAAPDTPARATLWAAEALGVSEEAAGSAFHRLLIDLGGWAQHARWLRWEAELAGGTDATITDLLAIRLVWEKALLAQYHDAIAPRWRDVVAAHAAPLAPTPDQVIDAILQEAAERAHLRRLGAQLQAPLAPAGRPVLQAAFCIDVRSEVFRRALESLDPGIDTLGFAGFFGLTVAHRALGSDIVEAHLPVLLTAGLSSRSGAAPEAEADARIAARASRAWGRFRQAAVSSFAFVEAAGPVYLHRLVCDAVGVGRKAPAPEPAPVLAPALTAEAKAATAAAVLRAMSLTQRHARLILLAGHGASVTNNPHESAYHCGACGGHTGEVSARLLATLLNDPETRAGLPAQGIALPADTLFLAALHDTTTDAVTLYEDAAAPDHAAAIAQARAWLAQAAAMARGERALRLPGAQAEDLVARARNWAEPRPEWGLAGCAAFIAAPREVTRGADLAGRAFLHSYDWRQDRGFSTLELILTAPVVVASWISLQYYGSSVAPGSFGSGNKLIHNVVGGLGVVEGNGGLLRAGLPWQAVHDGVGLAHEPLRLSVLIEAPQAAITEILARHDGVRALFDNGWLHLAVLQEGRITARYRRGLEWEAREGLVAAA
ncbi:YbcC family protein [Falsiroseomonas sp.]|uniref:YbcC family protein n=1 Tax=Falsiroseomonas sp. TaxID=2870721 RepID=UPI00271795DC|nr:DUF2309 domain-containing protein [Falsiroseomonas sp.]MDO9499070.1 DUF2309 domain-containing protein [Falsiroseomonas sp.]